MRDSTKINFNSFIPPNSVKLSGRYDHKASELNESDVSFKQANIINKEPNGSVTNT